MNSMKIIHYIPSIDRMAGGISTYMQVLAKPLGTMAEVHIMTHASENPLPMENCKVHDIPRYRPFSGMWKKAVVDLLDSVKPDIVHVKKGINFLVEAADVLRNELQGAVA